MRIEVINNVHFNVDALEGLNFDTFKIQFGRILGVKTLETWNKLSPLIDIKKEPEVLTLDEIAREYKNDFYHIEQKPKKKKKKFL